MTKKDKERAIIEEFLSSAGLEAAIQATEEPDFLLDLHDGRLIAAELTEFFVGKRNTHGAAKQFLAVQWERLLQHLLTKAEERARGCIVQIYLMDNEMLPRNEGEIESLAAETLDLVGRIMESGQSARSEMWSYEFLDKPMAAKHLKTIVVYRAQSLKQSEWQCPDTMGGEINVDDSFVQTLSDKTAKSTTYRANAPGRDLWLVIFSRDESGATLSPDREDVEAATRDWLSNSGFDQVWFYPGTGKQAYTL